MKCTPLTEAGQAPGLVAIEARHLLRCLRRFDAATNTDELASANRTADHSIIWSPVAGALVEIVRGEAKARVDEAERANFASRLSSAARQQLERAVA